MIKIQLSPKDKSTIKSTHWHDMKKQSTGLLKVLNTQKARDLLAGESRYKKLYNYFYDDSEIVIEKNVKSLLLANKKHLESFIYRFGKFSQAESEKLTKEIFRYDTFSTRKSAYDILRMEKVSVCPYCNRQYVFTLDDNEVRPQFDHYYPKSIYPYLAVSIFNLIPSCSICNQAKSTLDTYDYPILYPFEEEFGDEVRFDIDSNDIKYLHGMTDNFDISIQFEEVDSLKMKKIKRQNERLHLMELYDKHKDYVKDIAWNHHINSDDRIDEIMKKFPGMFLTKEDVISALYMNDVRKEKLGKRPLAKLTRDIYRELEIKTVK